MEKKHNDEDIIRAIQLETLKNLKIMDKICKKYGINYFLVDGSLLGAVRHKGFIPWDDDLDIGIMRSDYEKLCKVPASEWGEDAMLVTGKSSLMIHDKIFGRIYRQKSLIQSEKDIKEWKHPKTGEAFYTKLMCDLYVYDYAPDDDALFEKKKKKLRYLASGYKKTKYLARFDGSFKSYVKTILKNSFGLFMRFICNTPWKTLTEKYDKLAASDHETKRICTYLVDGTLHTKETYFPLRKVRFEDMEVPIPNDYDTILRQEYGDYMRYPPKNDRYHIQFIYADLGNGTKYIIDPLPGSLGEKELLTKRNV